MLLLANAQSVEDDKKMAADGTGGTRKTTLCEGDKGRSGKREQITSQRQQVDTKPAGKIIVVQ